VIASEDRLRQGLLLALEGDGSAYRTVLAELARHLRAYVRRRLASRPDEVEDLVQETLIAVHNQRHTYDPAQPLTAWVHAIARYKLIDFLRQHGRQERLFEPLDEDNELLAQVDDEAEQARRDVGQLLARLPDRHRLPIQHVKIEGLSVEEASRLTGMSPSAIKIGVHRGLKALAAHIRELHGADH